jgi:hypothetical protein
MSTTFSINRLRNGYSYDDKLDDGRSALIEFQTGTDHDFLVSTDSGNTWQVLDYDPSEGKTSHQWLCHPDSPNDFIGWQAGSGSSTVRITELSGFYWDNNLRYDRAKSYPIK